jgi:hypothetical protein
MPAALTLSRFDDEPRDAREALVKCRYQTVIDPVESPIMLASKNAVTGDHCLIKTEVIR